MRRACGSAAEEASEIGAQIRAGTSKIVSRKFGAVARVIWPEKTAFHLAAIADVSEYTARRWLAGEFEPPGVVLAAVLVEITKRG